LFSGGIRSASVTSRSLCKLLVLDWDNYDYLRRSKHPIAFAIEESALEVLSDRLRAVGDRIAALAKGTPVEHVTPSRGFFDRVASAFGSGGVMAPGAIDGAAVLGKSPLFAGTRAEHLAEVASHFAPMGARRGHFLCVEGETGNDMYVIATGSVDVLVSTGEDRVENVATLDPGEAFGMCALVQPAQPRMASCVAREKVTALTMGKIKWAEVATRGDMVGSALRVAMIRALCDQLAFANAQLAMLDHQSADLTRLARAGAAVEAHGQYLATDEDLPDYLKGVDQSW
jgi:CRP-like cAMP-binding protein